MNDIRVELYRGKLTLRRRLAGKGRDWRTRIVHANGNTLFDSAEGYENRADALAALNTVRNRLLNAPLVEVEGE